VKPNVDFREFRIEDFARARELWESTPGVGLSEADSMDNVARFLARNPALSFVAVEHGNVVGTILCGHDGRRGLIHHLAVSSDHRRRGIGRELVRRGLAALCDSGIRKCHLLVFRENAAAQAFWQRIGAEERTSLVTFSMVTAGVGPSAFRDP
jgi:ribosomal protein S18 acetylase RimI-like enzyme